MKWLLAAVSAVAVLAVLAVVQRRQHPVSLLPVQRRTAEFQPRLPGELGVQNGVGGLLATVQLIGSRTKRLDDGMYAWRETVGSYEKKAWHALQDLRSAGARVAASERSVDLFLKTGGRMGAPGPHGLPGVRGVDGAVGPMGLVGVPGGQGGAGVAGSVGLEGRGGPTGPAGAPGMQVWRALLTV